MDEIVVSPELAARFAEALEHSRAVFFSAPCGYGKTAVARALLPGRRTVFADARAESFQLPDPDGDWEVLLLDELQCLRSERGRRALCAMLQRGGERRFVLLSRGPVPAWLISFQAAGTLRVFDRAALTLDRDAALRLLRSRGAEPTAEDMNAIFRRTGGYPLALCCAALPCWRRAAAITARPAVPAARWRRWGTAPRCAGWRSAARRTRCGQRSRCCASARPVRGVSTA